ncbi:efflux RND transporter periplasmic adaptor subunit [Sulfurovum sp. XTW-4]|uniref:Efflux RND transporter periplasmic adaptor subunit n=1 Tax=Sulfurovum xiamenensis TaxID=3019066 RepID=A0ABT7QTE2_9BACT|nr:efflux RND transporter periplasmic adaptor subunit [Sulfurovum xiamenensis]MDM5264358.1 efflux RND transporter periplasmic adaptor subunit [Sulfurovum xiamenensis]
MKKMIVLLFAVLHLNAEEIYATFDVKAEKSASLAFSSSGIVGEMKVDIGSVVKKDELLAELLNDDIEAMVEVSKVALKYAQSDYERQKKVQQHINVSLFESYAYKYDNAKVQLKYQDALLEKTYLRAPFDGIITAKHIEVGDVVSGQMITEVYDIQSLKARKLILKFDQKYHKKVKVGDSFKYKVDGDDTLYTGTIYKIYPTIDSRSRKMLAEVKAERFPVGLFGDGYITVK